MRRGRKWVIVGGCRGRGARRDRGSGSRSGATTSETSQGSTRSWSSNSRDRVEFALEGCRRRRHWRIPDADGRGGGHVDDTPATSTTGAPAISRISTSARRHSSRQLAADTREPPTRRVPRVSRTSCKAAPGLNFESWDEINAILAEPAEQGVEVIPSPVRRPPNRAFRETSYSVMRRVSPIVLVACALAGVWGLSGSIRVARATCRYRLPGREQGHLPPRVCRPEGSEAELVLRARPAGRRREVGRPG